MATKGINYAGPFSNVNRDLATGIRYGVINHNEVTQAWADSSEPDYGEAHCPYCGNDAVPYDGDLHMDYASEPHQCDDFACDTCKRAFGSESAFGDEPNGFFLEDGEYEASCGEDGDIFILKSPYFTYAQFCSPCAPGACYLTNPLDVPDNDNRAYCFGADWFEDEKAPYPIYSVATGKLVTSAAVAA